MSNILAAVTRRVSKAGAGRSCEVRSSQGVKPEEPTCKNESVSAERVVKKLSRAFGVMKFEICWASEFGFWDEVGAGRRQMAATAHQY